MYRTHTFFGDVNNWIVTVRIAEFLLGTGLDYYCHCGECNPNWFLRGWVCYDCDQEDKLHQHSKGATHHACAITLVLHHLWHLNNLVLHQQSSLKTMISPRSCLNSLRLIIEVGYMLGTITSYIHELYFKNISVRISFRPWHLTIKKSLPSPLHNRGTLEALHATNACSTRAFLCA